MPGGVESFVSTTIAIFHELSEGKKLRKIWTADLQLNNRVGLKWTRISTGLLTNRRFLGLQIYHRKLVKSRQLVLKGAHNNVRHFFLKLFSSSAEALKDFSHVTMSTLVLFSIYWILYMYSSDRWIDMHNISVHPPAGFRALRSFFTTHMKIKFFSPPTFPLFSLVARSLGNW